MKREKHAANTLSSSQHRKIIKISTGRRPNPLTLRVSFAVPFFCVCLFVFMCVMIKIQCIFAASSTFIECLMFYG